MTRHGILKKKLEDSYRTKEWNRFTPDEALEAPRLAGIG